jgi:hypothetical protein
MGQSTASAPNSALKIKNIDTHRTGLCISLNLYQKSKTQN